MPQDLKPPDKWILRAETVAELIPLVVKIDGAPTTGYTIACVPRGQDPETADFDDPTTTNSGTGYLVNGPALGKGDHRGFYKLTDGLETVIKPAFDLVLL